MALQPFYFFLHFFVSGGILDLLTPSMDSTFILGLLDEVIPLLRVVLTEWMGKHSSSLKHYLQLTPRWCALETMIFHVHWLSISRSRIIHRGRRTLFIGWRDETKLFFTYILINFWLLGELVNPSLEFHS